MGNMYEGLPPLRPFARQGKAYYSELRALRNLHGQAMKDEVIAYKTANNGKLRTWELITVCLRYRLTLAAGFEILEDVNAIKCGTYDMIRRGARPSHLLRDFLAQYGLPDVAHAISNDKLSL